MKTTNKTSAFFSLIAIAMIAAVGTGASALATAGTTSDEPLTATVKYDDLDLSHAAGVSQLYGRIRRAAQTVCSPFEGLGAEPTQRWTQCVSAATDRAVATVNQPALVALHAAKTGKRQPAMVASLRN